MADEMNKERADFYAWLRTYEDEVGAVDEASAWVGFLGGRASLAASAGSEPVSFTAEHVAYINRYGGRCRDCADEGGICPNRGLPCADAPKAIQFVLEALAYGINNGYINARVHPSPPEGAGWMPIAEAPKDGTLIVLGARNGVWLGKYAPVYQSGFRPENPWSSMLRNHDHMAERYTRPTHWMPLPKAPAPPASEAKGA